MSGQHLSPLSNCNTRDLKIKLFSDTPALTLMQSSGTPRASIVIFRATDPQENVPGKDYTGEMGCCCSEAH